MTIRINGKEEIIERESSIGELLVLKKVSMPDMVSVSLNEEFVKRDDFNSVMVKENDAIEFLYFMGGGGKA